METEPAAAIPEGINESEYEDLEAPEDGEHVDSVNKRWRKVVKEGLVVPYRTVHAPACSFKTPNRKCFIPGRPIFIKITGIERGGVSTHLINPNLYVIQIQHGPFSWTIRRRYKHFQHLHQQLQLFRVAMVVPVPTRTHRERRSSYKTSIAQIPRDETGKSQGLPRFPKRPEALVSSDQLEERRKVLEQYLQDLVNIRAFRNHHETLEFLEVSHLSFVHGLGGKGKEGLVKKRTGTTHARRCTFGLCTCVNTSCLRLQRTCGECCGQWQRRWLIVKDTFVAYVRPKDGRLHCVMLLDLEFEVSSGIYSSGEPNGVVITNLSRQLMLKCWTKRRSKEWLDHLRMVASTDTAKSFIGPNRFISYAPVRHDIDAEWFVDGSSYMSAIADVLEAAQEEILISDWWLSPEIYMKRPIVEGERWRLDKILQRKAKEGVKIFVLLYKEVNLALGINSFYSKQKLVEQHPENIKVLRHPDHVSAGVLLWAHHEKLVIVDQSFAFVGGIDLCYGRWDDHIHRLADFGSVSASHPKLHGGYQTKMTSSKPLGGNHPMSILQLAKATNALTISTMVSAGGSTSSLPSHSPLHPSTSLSQLENLDETQTTILDAEEVEEEMKATFADLQMAAIPNGGGQGDLENVAETDETEENANGDVKGNGDVPLKGETPPMERRNLMRKVTKVTRELREDGREWVNRHLRKKDSHEGDSSDSDDEKQRKGREIDRKRSDAGAPETKHRAKRSTDKGTHPKVRKALSESAMGLKGSSKLWTGKDYANFIVKDFSDLESPFTDLVDRSSTPRMPWHDIGVMVQGTAARDVARHFIQRWNAIKDEKVPLNHLYPYLLPKSYDLRTECPVVSERKSTKVSCQIVRSLCQWSGGIRMIEESIQQAYIESIEDAKHYVYIENQFFISLAVSNSQVTNRIGEALLQRILRAHREKTVFRVFVVIPLLPGFEGEVGTNRGIAIHAITHWNYSSICRGPDALIVRLQMAGVEDPTQYVTFHGLRTHSELNGDLVTELIYVHSKLMIVDDLVVICGSANINDRSMTGKRDSEVCAIMHDKTTRPSLMNGKEFEAGPFAQSLRKYLFREHLGLMEDYTVDLQDPISEDFYRNVWIKTAETNTSTYDKVFHCVPTDCCVNFVQLQNYQQEQELAVTDPDAARVLLKENVKGHLVSLPLQFLKDENLLPSTGTKEALMPTQLWT